MKNIKGKLEVAANVSIITVAALLCVVLLKPYVIRTPVSPAPVRQPAQNPAGARGGIERGDAVSLPGIDWRKNGKTLLVVLSTTCHFCTQSGPFYRRLAREHGDARLVALVPQTADEGQSYLKRLKVEIDDVRQASLEKLGVSGTPTLVFVDADGVVADTWVGALTPDNEEAVLSRLGAERASK